MFSVAPNILLAPNMTQNAERKHRTQDANTAHNRLHLDLRGPKPSVSVSVARSITFYIRNCPDVSGVFYVADN